MHWGQDPVLEKHYVPTRSQRARSVLTFFAHNLNSALMRRRWAMPLQRRAFPPYVFA
jgi:hypothetical protein